MFFALVPAWAQTPAPADAEALRRRTQDEAEARRRQVDAPNVRLTPPAPQEGTQLPSETPCFPLRQVLVQLPTEVRGVSIERFNFLVGDLRPYVGQCVGNQGLQQILRRAGGELLQAGYTTTRVALPAQDLSSGILRLIIVPGLIGQIRFKEPTSLSWRSAFPTRPGEVLNLRDLEQGLEQLKRVVSQDVDFKIEPGTNPGESDIVIALRQEKPWRLGFALDDSGYNATGKTQASLNLAVDNLLNLNDIFSISGNFDAERRSGRKGSEGYNFQYSVPDGYWTWSVAGGKSAYRQVVQGVNQNFVSSGISQNLEARGHWTFARDQVSKSALQFRVGRRWNHSFLDDTEILVQKRNTTFAELSLQHRRSIGAAQLDVNLAARWGTPWFGAQRDAADLPAKSAEFGYTLQTLDINLRTPFKIGEVPFRYNATFRGQTAQGTLYATEQFLIGNRWTVRGFDGQGSLAAEKGAFLRNELEVPFGDSGYAGYLGIDAGHVSGYSARLLAGTRLAGAVLGLRGSPAKNVWFDAYVGHAIDKPIGFHTKQPALGFNLNFQL